MKTLALTSLLFSIQFLIAQEFTAQDNGFIYSNMAMEKLASIVAVKNGEFRRCDLSKPYLANEQSMGVFIDISGFKNSEIRHMIEGNPNIAHMVTSLGITEPLNYQLVVKENYENYNGKKMVQLWQLPLKQSISIEKNKYAEADFGLYILDEKSKILVHLKEPLKAKALPDKYARQIQYADCLIDTTTTVFEKEAVRGGGRMAYVEQERLKQDRLVSYIFENFPIAQPEYPKPRDISPDEFKKVYDSILSWEQAKRRFVLNDLANREKFKVLFEEAYEEACKNKNSSDEFENYVAVLKSYDAALELKRNRIVVGTCSMDESPRFHAQSIAKFSAEAYRWDIFLRAHLDIMNDNVSRVSDGSWAWEGRKTYIRELEALHIDIVDLILGISYRSSTTADGHYSGVINRLGRAMSESTRFQEFEATIIEAIADETLDDYNRLICYYLYDNMQWHKDVGELKEAYHKKIAKTVAFLPEYLRPEKG